MPGPHEFATPMPTKNASDQFGLRHEDRGALTHQLIAPDKDRLGQLPPYVTRRGEAVLRTLVQTH
jgi:hypothetical protein